jgi:hypothetical protein
VSEGVIADDVSCFDDLADDVGALFDVSSDKKESCADIVARENLEQTKGVGIVWSVVVGESDLLCAARKAGKSASNPLPGGGHGLVSSGNGSGSGRPGEQRCEHVRDFNDDLVIL